LSTRARRGRRTDRRRLVAAGTSPQLADHPLREALYGHPQQAKLSRGLPRRVRDRGKAQPGRPPPHRRPWLGGRVETEDEGAWLEIDSRTRIQGFDRQGIATLEPGDEIAARAQICKGELAGPLAVSIQPAA
jgi:hypothetical protein